MKAKKKFMIVGQNITKIGGNRYLLMNSEGAINRLIDPMTCADIRLRYN